MTCPVCLCGEGAPTAPRVDLALLRCPNCGFVFVDLAKWHYPYQARDYYDGFEISQVRPDRPHILHRVEGVLRRAAAPGRGVDLGCGCGETAIALARRGFTMEGVDESRAAIAGLKDTFPEVRWTASTLEAFLERGHSFDLVTMYHVLEHIPHPGQFLEILAPRLRSEGLLVVEVPDVDGRARYVGKRWEHWNAHHVNYFSVPTLERLLGRFGFSRVGLERKYHFQFPQRIAWRDAAHTVLARLGMHDIVTTYWSKP